jgi:hypothetical protein
MPILRILPGAQRGASIPVTEPVVIGRSRGAGLTFEERTLSRLHARLESTGGAWRLIDLNSSKAQRGFFQGTALHPRVEFLPEGEADRGHPEWEMVSAMDPGYKEVARNLQKAKTLQERLDAVKRSKPQ